MIDQNKRDRPYTFIERTIELLRSLGGKRVLEIGSARQPLNHDLNCHNYLCCNDGHSTALFAASGLELDTVDINPNVTSISIDILKKYSISTCTATCCDGIDYIKKYDKKIDLLYLDAWDVDIPESPEKHLEAYLAAKAIMNEGCLILIDDTDVDFCNGELIPACSFPGGKGKLLSERAVKDGYSIVFTGRQTLFQKYT
jgi:hypothetical protein